MWFEQDRPGSSIMDAVELRIQIKGVRPPVWRRIIVHPDTDLKELHRLISVLFELDKGQDHPFRFRGAGIPLDDSEYETCRISKFLSGHVLTYFIDDLTRPACSVKVVRKDRKRNDQLPCLIAGMRTLMGGSDKDPYDMISNEIEAKLRTFRRYDELVPDQDGKMVEPWRAGALTSPDDLLEDLDMRFPGSDKIKARMKARKPLEPVAKKVPPDTPVELRIALKDMPSPVWRLVRVNSQIKFDDLHTLIQRSFGWENTHLYAFTVGDTYIQSFDEDDVEDFPIGTEVIDARGIRLRDIMTGKGWSIPYLYDFGDGWTHVVKVVKVHLGEPPLDRMELLDGSGACPPEDCGGPYGYQELIDILNDPKNREHDEIAEWFGAERLDPEEFDIEAARRKFMFLWRMD